MISNDFYTSQVDHPFGPYFVNDNVKNDDIDAAGRHLLVIFDCLLNQVIVQSEIYVVSRPSCAKRFHVCPSRRGDVRTLL